MSASLPDFLGASKLEDQRGLCLSGGGYRAMLYHAGAMRYLNDVGFLSSLAEVSSVSGGSIAAGVLATAWSKLHFRSGVATNFDALVGEPIRRFAQVAIDIKAVIFGFLPGRCAADYVAGAYDLHLFRGATLQDLPDAPRFTFLATNLQTGSAWRFARDYCADYRVGRIERPKFSLSRVVAASSAFPPVLSPVVFDLSSEVVEPFEDADLAFEPYTKKALLTDGGVYDNFGLERVWKRCRTVLVSNAGKAVPELTSPSGRWIGQTLRTLNLFQRQSEHLRRRILTGLDIRGDRRVAQWDIQDANGEWPPPFAEQAAGIRTRLNRFSRDEIDLLQLAGYFGAQAALRAKGLTTSPAVDLAEQFAETLGARELFASVVALRSSEEPA